ncbi:MAG: zinc ribbon domain-containing protein [Candidatus Omnitrophica bacterium]|nr:zinc ribbon domain-containing protein [Candidatus Omnitrophota bacterium]
MPTYEYKCGHCGRRFERFQPITSKPAAPCPKCKRSAKRLISAGAGLLFKGSGFYATDYRSSDYKKKAKSEGQPPCGASSKAACPKPSCKA